MPINSAASLRDQLEQRRAKKHTTGLLRLPFMLDESLADDMEQLGKQAAKLEERLDQLAEAAAAADDEDPEADVRASGADLSPDAAAVAEVEVELARVKAELQDAIDASESSRVWMLFRRASADEYEQLLRKHGGSKMDAGSTAEREFLNALTERCFVAIEMPDGTRDDMPWAEFVKAAELSAGELTPIRSMVWAENARGGNSIPFSSGSSRKTRNS